MCHYVNEALNMLMDHAMHHWGLALMRFKFIMEIETPAEGRALGRFLIFDVCVKKRVLRAQDSTRKWLVLVKLRLFHCVRYYMQMLAFKIMFFQPSFEFVGFFLR